MGALVDGRRRRSICVGWALLLILVAGVSCSDSRPSAPRLVILYATCSVNKAYLSPYEPTVAFTPNLRRFGERSVVFENHQTEAGQSGIAYASLFSGSQAPVHGVFRHPTHLSDDLYLISEAYADAGYETFFFNAHPMGGAKFNYGQGVSPENTVKAMLTAVHPRFRQILERLAEDDGYRAFIVTNFTVTHSKYAQNPITRGPGDPVAAFIAQYGLSDAIESDELRRYEKMYVDNQLRLQWNYPEVADELGLSAPERSRLSAVIDLLYRVGIRRLDELFGAVIDAVESAGLLEESLIAFTADHGEILDRENALFKWTHGLQLAPEVLGVPFILYAPTAGLERGKVEQVTRSIDVFPTLAGLSGIDVSSAPTVSGVDLSADLAAGRRLPDLRAHAHTSVLPRGVLKHLPEWRLLRRFHPRVDPGLMWVAIREGETTYKWRRFEAGKWGMEVFDHAIDPGEARNAYTEGDPRQAEMRADLVAYKKRLVEAAQPTLGRQTRLRAAPALEREREEALRALGYID